MGRLVNAEPGAPVLRLRRRPPDTPRSRWDDSSCGIPGCPCAHNPDSAEPCDRGWTTPPAEGKTGGIPGIGGSAIVERLLPAGDAVRRCPTCVEHAKDRAKVREEARALEAAG